MDYSALQWKFVRTGHDAVRWACTLGCSEDEILDAVKATGNCVEKIARHVHARRSPNGAGSLASPQALSAC